MNRRLLLIAGLMLCGISAFGQTYERVCRNNFWNDGRNATGIRQDSTNVAFVELYGGYKAGGFHDYGAASGSWKAGACTKAFKHFQRLSLAGGFSFEQTQGYNMFGTMFTEPGYYPVNILEFTPGTKTLQKYTFDGSISYDLNSNWRIGASMDFLSANLSKSKDLRHTNYRLDFSIEPSLMWHSRDWAVGITGIIGKNSENIDAEVIGTVEFNYDVFFDKGLMYGLYEDWEGSGIHLEEAGVNGFPVRESLYGAAAQMSWKKLYVDLEWLYSDGKIGEKDFLWYKFPGHRLKSHLAFGFDSGKYSHSFRLMLSMLTQVNKEAILDKTTEGGVTTVTVYSFNKIFERNTFGVEPEYEVTSDIWELRWKGKVGIFNGIASQKYPFAHQQDIMDISTSVSTMVHLWRFDIGAGVGCSGGFFEEKERLLKPSAESNRPHRLEDYAAYRIEYITTPRINAGLSLRYNFLKGLYVQADGGLAYALKTENIVSGYRAGGNITIGYDF